MIRIQKVQLREIHLRLREPFQISSGVSEDRRILLVELTDVDGLVGWGECVAPEYPNYSPETIDTCWLAISDWVVPRVLNVEFDGPGGIHPALQTDFRGHNMAKAAVEMAAWELSSRREGLSLAGALGGSRALVPVGISIGIQKTPGHLVSRVRKSLDQGYRKIKVKIQPGQDFHFLEAVYEEFGDHLDWMVDANNAYSLGDLAQLRKLDRFGLMMIEQPLAWDDLLCHAELQAQLQTPICLDESITSVDRARDMLALKAGRIVNIKPGRVGGFHSSLEIHDFCERNDIPVWCGGMLESGVGRAHNIALASLPNFRHPGDLSPSSRYWERDIVKPEWEMDSNGMVRVPFDKSGMGVELDLDFVDGLTVRQEVLTG